MPFPPPHLIASKLTPGPAVSTETGEWFLRNLEKTFNRAAVPDVANQRLVFYASCSYAQVYCQDFANEDSPENATAVLREVNEAIRHTGWSVTDWTLQLETCEITSIKIRQLPSGHEYYSRSGRPVATVETKDRCQYTIGQHRCDTIREKYVERERVVVFMSYARPAEKNTK